jgi:hypothetical protein
MSFHIYIYIYIFMYLLVGKLNIFYIKCFTMYMQVNRKICTAVLVNKSPHFMQFKHAKVYLKWDLHDYCGKILKNIIFKKNDRNTTLLQQVYNSSLIRGGPHTLWSPPHVRGLLYTCCKSVVRESVLNF